MALRARKRRSEQADGTDGAAKNAKPVKPKLTPGNAKRLIGVAKVVGPVLLPFAISAAGYLRHRWEVARAHRLGVPVDDLPEFTGKGAALHARLVRLGDAMRELTLRHPDNQEAARFAERSTQRLADLAAAVRAAEQMPAPRRKAAHGAVATELDTMESTLLTHLGV